MTEAREYRLVKEHRMRQGAKKEVERAEIAVQRMRAKAAALLAPELPKQGAYVYKILRHRDTGVRVRVLDTQAPDAPAGLFDLPLRFVVECETHGGSQQSYATVHAAMGAARRSYDWCEGCAEVMGPRPSESSRPRSHADAHRHHRGHYRGPGHGLHVPHPHRPGHAPAPDAAEPGGADPNGSDGSAGRG